MISLSEWIDSDSETVAWFNVCGNNKEGVVGINILAVADKLVLDTTFT